MNVEVAEQLTFMENCSSMLWLRLTNDDDDKHNTVDLTCSWITYGAYLEVEEKSLSSGEESHFFSECFMNIRQKTSAGTSRITDPAQGDVIQDTLQNSSLN